MRAVNIEWDTDGDQEILESLPKEVQMPIDVRRDEIGDYLSDTYGYCHFGYQVLPNDGIEETGIDASWLLPEDVRWRAFRLHSPAELADTCRTLYGDCRVDRIKGMSHAPYPAIAIFAVSDDGEWGRCLGTAEMLESRWKAMLESLGKEAGHA